MGFFLALANDDDLDFLANRRIGNDARQIVHLFDVAAIEFDDDVAWLEAAGLRRSTVVDAGNQGAVRRLDREALGDVVGDLLDAHTEPAAPGLAELAELIDHGDGRVRRHRKADADRTAGRR